MRPAAGRRRPAYILLVAIATLMVLVTVAVVVAKHAAVDIRRERTALLESAAEQVLQSARCWGRVHTEALNVAEAVTLPVDDYICPGMAGSVELRLRSGEGQASRIECRLELRRGRMRLTRLANWSVGEVSIVSPAEDAARP
jgi:hypothetical protein